MRNLGGRTRPSLAALATLAAAIDADQRTPMDALRRRDHEIGTRLGRANARSSSKAIRAVLVDWLSAVTQQQQDLATWAEHAAMAKRGIDAFMFGLGLLLGWLTTLGVFYYNGAGRVNVLSVMAVFVVMPLVLLLPLMLASMPTRAVHWLPGGPAVVALARLLGPARVLGLLERLLPRTTREALELALGRAGTHQRLYADVHKWALIRWSQMLAVGFSSAAITTATALVVFTDIAFGWSTTLRIEPNQVHTLTQWISMPWAWLVDVGRPRLDLVDVSEYYRLQTAASAQVDPAKLGQWWPFLILAMLTYGLTPRMITLCWSHQRLQSAVNRAFVHTPGIQAILSRLDSGLVETRGEGSEQETGKFQPQITKSGPGKTSADHQRSEVTDTTQSSTCASLDRLAEQLPPLAHIINWSAVPITDDALAGLFAQTYIHHAGGSQTLDQDRAVIERIAQRQGQTRTENRAQAVGILVKSWEPPLMELLDLLEDVRRSLGEGPPIIVIPAGINQSNQITPPSPEHQDMWSRKLASMTDPWLTLVQIAPSQTLTSHTNEGGGHD